MKHGFDLGGIIRLSLVRVQSVFHPWPKTCFGCGSATSINRTPQQPTLTVAQSLWRQTLLAVPVNPVLRILPTLSIVRVVIVATIDRDAPVLPDIGVATAA